MTETLKECPNPWCNEKRRMARVRDIPAPTFRVICGCGVMGPMMLVEAEAITAWNTRPREAELEAEVGRLREQLGALVAWKEAIHLVAPELGGRFVGVNEAKGSLSDQGDDNNG